MSFDEQARQYRRRLAGCLPKDRDARILDLGCGRGTFLVFLQQVGYHNAEGVDASEPQVRQARTAGVQRLEVCDALSFLLDRRALYDLISAQNLLEHLTREELFQLLDGIAAALKPEGKLLGVVPNSKGPFSARVRYADITHELSFTPESLREVFDIVGLRIQAVREQAPVVHGFMSAVRWLVWQAVRGVWWLALVAESADYRDRVYTRDMMFLAVKPQVQAAGPPPPGS